VVFSQRSSIAGWTWPEALVVLGWFSLLKAILEGSVNPSLTAVVEGVRTGALDFVLLKPADAQFLVSTARFEPWHVIDILGSLGIIDLRLLAPGRWPAPAHVLTRLVLLVVAVLLLYSIWILVVSASFWVVRVDNLSYLFGSIFDAGRWPIDVFSRVRILWVPSPPSSPGPDDHLPGRGAAGQALVPAGADGARGGLLFAGVARVVWMRAIRYYTSASS
jgi:ABC-2 type transport system permease protein